MNHLLYEAAPGAISASSRTRAIVISAVAGSSGLLCGQIGQRIDEGGRPSQR